MMTPEIAIQVTFILAIGLIAVRVVFLSSIPFVPKLLAAIAVILWMCFWFFRLLVTTGTFQTRG